MVGGIKNMFLQFYLGAGIGWLIMGTIFFIINPTEFFKFFEDGGKING